MSRIELREVSKSYGRSRVVHNVALDIAEGEFVVLVGPSGCGKSTILRMVAGLEEITTGQVLIDGRVLNDIDPKGRNVAMVFQNYALYPHMSVRENIGLNLRLSRLPKPEIARRVAHAAGMLDIAELLDRRPAQLSGGQRQRVAMGRAMVRNPAVFLFDEPLSNLDAKLRVQMRAEIKRFHRETGTTSIYVTHDQVEAMTLADRIAVFNNGRIEQIGEPVTLYEKPCNLFVAGFIGSPAMNVFSAQVRAAGGGARELAAQTGWIIPLAPDTTLREGTAITVGIRPEHLALAVQGAGYPGIVTQIEITGAQTALEASFSGLRLWSVVNRIVSARIGDTLSFTFDPAAAHFFDASDGRRIDAKAPIQVTADRDSKGIDA